MNPDYPFNINFPTVIIVGGASSPESNGQYRLQRFAAASRSYNRAGRRHAPVPINGGDVRRIAFRDEGVAPTKKNQLNPVMLIIATVKYGMAV